MPSATIFVSDQLEETVIARLAEIRGIIASELSTSRKVLSPDQVSIRISSVKFQMQLSPVEVEIFGHAFWHRLRRLDHRALGVATAISNVVDAPVSCWVNLSIVGYFESATASRFDRGTGLNKNTRSLAQPSGPSTLAKANAPQVLGRLASLNSVLRAHSSNESSNGPLETG